MPQRHLPALALACALALLSACDSAEERAEKHFQSAVALVEAGDIDRAMVEFRNVFKLNGRHEEARVAYAGLLRENGRLQEAYGQYLRLVEQYPQNIEGRRALTEMALETGNWEEVERHAAAAAALAPDDPLVRAVTVALAYRKALEAKDAAAQATARAEAVALLKTQPGLIVARRVVIDDLIRQNDWEAALAEIDAGLATAPGALDLYTLRLGLLQEMGDTAAIEAQLNDMVARFPTDENSQRMLVGWHIQQGNLDAAEAHLRGRIDPADEKPDAQIVLIEFLQRYRGVAAAREEIARVIAAGGPRTRAYRAMLAGLDFDAGRTEAAITEMQALVEGAEASAETRSIKVALAQMLIRTGNPVGARALVEEVLAEDPSEVAALKLKAAWLIEDDRTGDAIVALRAALGQSPRDPGLMTLMAGAHERDGNRELMGEMLALAVEASGSAPAESLRYAAFLAEDSKLLPAEDVLLAALRLQPQDTGLLGALGGLYIELRDWGRAEQTIRSLKDIGGDTTVAVANELTARKLSAQDRGEDLIAFLDTLAAEAPQGGAVAVIRAHVARGDLDAAQARVEEELARTPDDPSLMFLKGAVLASRGETAEAEAAYRAVLAVNARAERVWLALYGLRLDAGGPAAALPVLDEALAALPDSAPLQFTKAGALERAGDIDGAIAIYEALYAADSTTSVVANNLASLLVTYREDEDSLARAELIARRLRGTRVPAFQDTYGWITFRRGNAEEALGYLEPAAAALGDDPAVQYHLGAALAALGRTEAARTQFDRALALIDPAGPEPAYLAALEAARAGLDAAPGTPPAAEGGDN